MEKSRSRGPQAQGFILTWPRCPLSRQAVISVLHSVGSVKCYIVASEKHKDGTDHLHAWVDYHNKVQWSPTRWDIFDAVSGELYHGNYQTSRDAKACAIYCQKEDNYDIYNMDLPMTKQQKCAARNKMLLSKSLHEHVRDGTLPLLHSKLFLNALAALRAPTQPVQTESCRGIWLFGESGFGKSHFARDRYPGAYYKTHDKWFNGYAGEEFILLEDFSNNFSDVSDSADCLKLWADKWPVHTQVKQGDPIPLRHTKFIITSQYLPWDFWGLERQLPSLQAITRRFQFFHFHTLHHPPQEVTLDILNKSFSPVQNFS